MSMTKYKLKYLGVILFIITIFIGLKIGGQDNVPLESKKIEKIENIKDAKEVIEGEINAKKIPPHAMVVLYKYELKDETIIKEFTDVDDIGTLKIDIGKPGWLYIVDENPYANFAHPIEIRLIDPNFPNPDKHERYTFNWWPVINEGTTPYFVQTEDSPYKIIQQGLLGCRYEDDVRDRLFCDSSYPGNNPDKLVGKKEAIKQEVGKNIWAIIICGSFAYGDVLAFTKDTDSMYSVLKGYGVPTGHIAYFMPDEVKKFINGPRGKYKTKFKFKNTDASKTASIDNIEHAFTKISGEIKKNKNSRFLFLISTHGKYNSLVINDKTNERINSQFFQKLINQIECERMYILIDACRSGSFENLFNPPSTTKRFLIFSCGPYEYSYSDMDNMERDLNENNGDRGTEFLGGYIDAFTIAAKADKDGNRKISLGEAFDYAKEHAYCTDARRCGCDIRSAYPCNHPDYRTNSPEEDALYKEFLFWK